MASYFKVKDGSEYYVSKAYKDVPGQKVLLYIAARPEPQQE